MIVVRAIIGVLALIAVGAVLASVVRTLVVPRAIPARLPRFAFLAVRAFLRLRLRLWGRADFRARDRVFALQGPLALFVELLLWGLLVFLLFAALFWSLGASSVSGASVVRGLEQSGSSMLTLGFDTPRGLVRQLMAFAAAGVGLSLFALVIAYLPTLYDAFSRREAQITKLVVLVGAPPTGPAVLSRGWEHGHLERLDEFWNAWEDWFIQLGESHTTFPQLGFFRSAHPENHWVLAAEAVLDGAALSMTVCDLPRQSRCQRCLDAGVHALSSIVDFLGMEPRLPETEAQISLSQETFKKALRELQALSIQLPRDPQAAWFDFRSVRVRYEPQLAVLGRITDAPRSDWSSWPDSWARPTTTVTATETQ